MIKAVLRILVVVVIGVLIYNYFLGTPEEKANAKRIFNEVKEVGVAVKDLVKSEKEKFDEGKYDAALDKIGGVFNSLKENSSELSGGMNEEIDQLEAKRKELSAKLKVQKPESEAEQEAFKKELQQLVEDTEKMVNKLE